MFRIGNRVADFDIFQPDDRRNIAGRGFVDFDAAQLVEHVIDLPNTALVLGVIAILSACISATV